MAMPREERPGEIVGRTLGEVEGWNKDLKPGQKGDKETPDADTQSPCTPIHDLQYWQGALCGTPDGDGQGGPPEHLLRGTCPVCGGGLVSMLDFVKDVGYMLVWCCWNTLVEVPTCEYRRRV